MNWIFYFCIQQEDSLEKLSDMIEHVTLQLNELCNCDLTAEYIADKRLICNPDQPGEVILQGRIVTITEKNSTDLLMMLQEWVLDKPTIVVQGVQLKVDPECSVELENLGDTECRSPTPNTTSGVGPSLPLPALGGGIGGVLAIMVLVVIVVGVIIYVKKKGTNYTPSEGTEGVR